MNVNRIDMLPKPHIPDYDDGVIDQTDILSNNIEAVMVYSGAQAGDTLELFLDNQLISTLVVITPDDIPASSLIDQSLLSNGSHRLDYTVTDTASNMSVSDALIFFVQRDSVAERIVAPVIIDGEDGCLTDDEIAQLQGAQVFIPPSDALTAHKGDTLTLIWVGYDSTLYPVDTGYYEYTVAIDDTHLQGFTVAVPETVVRAAMNGGANVYYYISSGGGRIFSGLVSIQLGTCSEQHYQIRLSSDRTWFMADGQDHATLTALVTDNLQQQPAAGQAVHWQTTEGTLTPLSSVTDAQGAALAWITSLVPGRPTISASLDSGESDTLSVDAVAQGDSYTLVSLTAVPDSIIAGGLQTSTLSARVVNEEGSGAAGIAVNWHSTLGDLSVQASVTDEQGLAYCSFSSIVTGTAAITASLTGGSTRQTTVRVVEQARREMKVMGARTTQGTYARQRQGRLVCLDNISLTPVTATWQYDDGTDVTTAAWFLDTRPEQRIRVSAPGYYSVTLNLSNLLGNGSFIENGVGPGAFAARLDSGHVTAWGHESYGGDEPSLSAEQLMAASHAFVGWHGNKIRAWGSEQEGGTLPATVAGRQDVLSVQGAHAAFAAIFASYPYLSVWGSEDHGTLTPPDNLVNKDNLYRMSASADAFAVLDREGYVHAWGTAQSGGTLPEHIARLNDVYACYATERAFAVLFGDAQVSAWGDESYGGDESACVGVTGIQRLFSTDGAFAGLLSDGQMIAWGASELGGEIPAGYVGINDVVDICSTYGAFCALRLDGTVIAWGDSRYGGDSQLVQRQLHDVVAISSSGAAFAALSRDGSVVVWGDARDGGDASAVMHELYNIQAIYGNSRAMVALRADSTLVAWGEPDSGGSGAPAITEGNISYLLP